MATALAIYDIATARASVRAYNRRIGLAPWIAPHRVGIVAIIRP